ncbi:MAG: 3-dehydroquinate synthase [Verrucomicrobiota bacterium]
MLTETVTLPHHRYDIIVENGSLTRLGQLLKVNNLTGKVALISDSNVAPHYFDPTLASLSEAGFQATTHSIPAGEASKSMTCVEQVCREMIQAGHDRSSLLIALGGGVVGDLAGFVASTYYRGIPFVQIPTTIVSQVDSSVGGKTGVNTPEGKNLLGAFHQPTLVLIDPTTLTSLPAREYREGYAEVIKHAAIRDADMLADIEALDLNAVPPPASLLQRNLAIKARIVEEDEKETTGTRALLNFGHTIGHAIEASVPYGQLLHGEAISLGIRAALHLSEHHTNCPPADSQRILNLLNKFQLPLQLPDSIPTASILEKMQRDKKFSAGKRTFVLLKQAGHAITTSDVPPTLVQDAINLLRQPVS